MPIFTVFLKRQSNRYSSPFLFPTPPYDGARHPLRNPSGPVFNMIGRGGLAPPAAGGGENPAEQEVRAILIMFATFPFEGEPPSPTLLSFTVLSSLKHIGRPRSVVEVDLPRWRGWTTGRFRQKILLRTLLSRRPQPPRSPRKRAPEARRWPNLSGAERGRGSRLLKRYVTRREPRWGGGGKFCAIFHV